MADRYPSVSTDPGSQALREMGTATPCYLLHMIQRCLPEWEPNQRLPEHTRGPQIQLEPPNGPSPRTPNTSAHKTDQE